MCDITVLYLQSKPHSLMVFFWFANLTAVIRDSCGICKNVFVKFWHDYAPYCTYYTLSVYCFSVCFSVTATVICPPFFECLLNTFHHKITFWFDCLIALITIVFCLFQFFPFKTIKSQLIYPLKTEINNIFNLKNRMVFLMK